MARRALADLSPLGTPWVYLVSPYEQNLHSIPNSLVLNAQSSMYPSPFDTSTYVDFITLCTSNLVHHIHVSDHNNVYGYSTFVS